MRMTTRNHTSIPSSSHVLGQLCVEMKAANHNIYIYIIYIICFFLLGKLYKYFRLELHYIANNLLHIKKFGICLGFFKTG